MHVLYTYIKEQTNYFVETIDLVSPPFLSTVSWVKKVGKGNVMVWPDDIQHNLGSVRQWIETLDILRNLIHPFPFYESGILEI